ncbi:threonylcarbamoyl-AMP synthase [Candidatus Gottesmanbacteria bacterium]|nr:threonylcarbamoyl-AMP synthase [Candidatus Gottesmanbacteria bacterium]
MNDADKAIGIVKKGGIIIFPTDTAFGIGCRIDDHAAVDRLFSLRRRPISQAMPVLVSSMEMANYYFDPPSDIVRRLMKTYWPGALTIVAKCKSDLIYSPIRGGGDTVGLRMPNHETTLEIIKKVGVPILGSSANFHGSPTPYRAEDIDPKLVKLVDYVMPGECSLKQASTVVDCTCEPYSILRQGAVTII